MVGLPQDAWDITSLARELLALEQVSDETPELQGDQVATARRLKPVSRSSKDGWKASWTARLVMLSGIGNTTDAEPLTRGLSLTAWRLPWRTRSFKKSPRLHNELLNRGKPSSNGAAARNALLRRMVLSEGEARLGIEGFPAEGGLFASLLEATGLYRRTIQGWTFVAPTANDEDTRNLGPAWRSGNEVSGKQCVPHGISRRGIRYLASGSIRHQGRAVAGA